MAIKPLSDRVLIEMKEEDVEKVGSLYVPDTAKEKPQQGKVVAVGVGKRDGKDLIPMTVKVGDIVLYGRYSGTEVKHDGKDYLIVAESDILAVIA
ncbi:MAG: co-chaperone GroES [Spirochaetes bacterium]|nr:co-chaperone GroES [Spirochaetota bacterium]